MVAAAAATSLAFNIARAAPPLPEAAAHQVGFSDQGLARLDDFFAREIAAKRVPGAVVAIARDGRLVHYKAYGQLDPVKGTPMPIDAVFALASAWCAVAGSIEIVNPVITPRSRSRSMRASSSPIPTGRISVTRSETVPLPV